jgi:hypothetical protein
MEGMLALPSRRLPTASYPVDFGLRSRTVRLFGYISATNQRRLVNQPVVLPLRLLSIRGR